MDYVLRLMAESLPPSVKEKIGSSSSIFVSNRGNPQFSLEKEIAKGGRAEHQKREDISSKSLPLLVPVLFVLRRACWKLEQSRFLSLSLSLCASRALLFLPKRPHKVFYWSNTRKVSYFTKTVARMTENIRKILRNK